MLKEGDPINSIIVVKSGILEVIKEIDGLEICMARLNKGASMNSRSMMFEGETAQVTIRCKSRANLLILSIKDLNEISVENPNLKHKITQI